MVRVISEYPQQALWPMVGVMKSCQDERRHACIAVFQKATVSFVSPRVLLTKNKSISTTIRDADTFSTILLQFTDHKVDGRKREKSIQSHFPYVKYAFPTKMILPLQDALTCSLPTSSDTVKTHNPFPNTPIEIHGKFA